MKSYILLKKEGYSLFSIRFYKEKIDLMANFKLLPEYIGSGIARISGNCAYIFATTIDSSIAKLEKHHVTDLIKGLSKLGCSKMEWERHKEGKIKTICINFDSLGNCQSPLSPKPIGNYMSEVVSALEKSNTVVNVTEIRTAGGDLVAKLTREYGVVANPIEVIAFEEAILEHASALAQAD